MNSDSRRIDKRLEETRQIGGLAEGPALSILVFLRMD